MKIWEILQQTSSEMLAVTRDELRDLQENGQANSEVITAKAREATEFYNILQGHDGSLKREVIDKYVRLMSDPKGITRKKYYDVIENDAKDYVKTFMGEGSSALKTAFEKVFSVIFSIVYDIQYILARLLAKTKVTGSEDNQKVLLLTLDPFVDANIHAVLGRDKAVDHESAFVAQKALELAGKPIIVHMPKEQLRLTYVEATSSLEEQLEQDVADAEVSDANSSGVSQKLLTFIALTALAMLPTVLERLAQGSGPSM